MIAEGMPLFSILIANYNNGRYLQEALDSVFRQTCQNWEVILVDDASTDGLSELIYQKYTDPDSSDFDPRIRVFHNDGNHGCGYTKRRCAELAQGELCGFLDPDDALTENAVEVMVREHKQHPEVSLVAARYWCADENLKPLWLSREFQNIPGRSFLTDEIHNALVFSSFKTAMYRQTAGINPVLKRAVDMDLYFRLEEVAPFLYLSLSIYIYRMYAGGISQGNMKAQYWHILAIKDAAERRGIEAENIVDMQLRHGEDCLRKELNNIKASRYYRLGYALIHPWERVYRKLTKIWRSIKNK